MRFIDEKAKISNLPKIMLEYIFSHSVIILKTQLNYTVNLHFLWKTACFSSIRGNVFLEQIFRHKCVKLFLTAYTHLRDLQAFIVKY